MLQYCFCFLFFIASFEVCGILDPWPRIKPTVLHWKVSYYYFFLLLFIYFNLEANALQYCGGFYHIRTLTCHCVYMCLTILNPPPISLFTPSLWVVLKHQLWVCFFMLEGGFSATCSCSVSKLCPTLATPQTAAFQDSLSFTISRSLLKLMSIEYSDAIQPCQHLLTLLLLPSIFPRIRVFSDELALLIRWPKYWNFSFIISPSMNSQRWFPLGMICCQVNRLALQGNLKSLLQHHNSKATILPSQLSLWSNSHTHIWQLEKP